MATAEGAGIQGSPTFNATIEHISKAIKSGSRTVDELRVHVGEIVDKAVSQSTRPDRARKQILHPDKYTTLDKAGKKILEDIIKNPVSQPEQEKPSRSNNTKTTSGNSANTNTEKPWEQYGKSKTNDIPPWQTNPNKATKNNEPPPWTPKGENKPSSGSTDDDLPWKKSAPKKPEPEVRRGYEFRSFTSAPIKASEKDTQEFRASIAEAFGIETSEVLQKTSSWKNLMSDFSLIHRGKTYDIARIIHRTLKLVNAHEPDIKNYLFQSRPWREFLSTPDNSNLEWKIKRVLEAINRVAELLKKTYHRKTIRNN